MPFTYILFSKSINRYYIGATTLLPEERLNYHLLNHKGYTSKAKDWKIVFHSKFISFEDALSLERRIKKRGAKRYLDNPFQ